MILAKREMAQLTYREKSYQKLKFTFSKDISFQRILNTLNKVRFDGVVVNDEQAIYAILELVNNSLRAHREKDVKEKIILHLKASEDLLHIRLKDKGGGFDPESLPYNLFAPVEEIDTCSDAFEGYREKHQYRRFGMGLLLARKIFPGFRLSFYQENGHRGTIIDLSNRSLEA